MVFLPQGGPGSSGQCGQSSGIVSFGFVEAEQEFKRHQCELLLHFYKTFPVVHPKVTHGQEH